MGEYNSVEECLAAGNTWEQCVGFAVEGDAMKMIIKKSCPRVMRDALKEKVFKGEAVIFKQE